MAGRRRVGRRLRVRLDGPGRHGGRGLRRRSPLARPALPEAAPAPVSAHADAHPHADTAASAASAETDTHPRADADTDTDT
ncbi:hypothetical protein S1361_34615 [Streptomyces cyanogenus]|uniref:Uncharacterized protein n=1 Tax=Streptomyces cyanogenus TaxID=80860 RepID=A0ABX7U0F9_STRCY|nr:hypothetical protein S1361_34615 [Streptomyces cyanogenus]